jgi:micrococcal nuclease
MDGGINPELAVRVRPTTKAWQSMGKFFAAIFIIAVASGLSSAASAKPNPSSNRPWPGVVTHVADGDTLWVRPASGGAAVNIRIEGIDAPEVCQRHGPEAKAALSSRVMRQPVLVQGSRRDTYGRLLVRVTAQETDVGQWMVGSGKAWAHAYKRHQGAYGPQQAQAQAARRGLFADAQAEHPRDFRKRHGPCPHGGQK